MYYFNLYILKRHYAVGLLYDIYVCSKEKHSQISEKSILPWEINIHFSDFPKNKLIKIKDLNTLKDTYFTTLKEVCIFLLYIYKIQERINIYFNMLIYK